MGRPAIDLTNQKFGYLTVLRRDDSRLSGAGKSVYWLCKCECGNIKSVRTDKLRKGEVVSCGCYSKKIRTEMFLKDLKGQKFGRLTVLYRDENKPKGSGCFSYWVCRCDCGNLVSVRGDHLRDGTTSSCGCLNSSGEEEISKILQECNITYKTQFKFNDLIGDAAPLRFDFAIFNNDNLIGLIEFQGCQHYRKWGNEDEERFQKRLRYDKKKVDYCQTNNINLLIIPYTEQSKLSTEYLYDKIKGWYH